ncbi:MAG: hypothetical protein ACI9E1_000199 [Cryomorphaceae bacterium]|jgi:hypothetical protein
MNSRVVTLSSFNRVHCYQKKFCRNVSVFRGGMLVMILFGLIQLPSFSQATSKRKVEYGKAIGELIKLGYPNAEGARYVNLKDQSLQYGQGGFSSISSNKRPSLLGNGFYIANKDKLKPGRFITLAGVELGYSKKRGQSSNARGDSYSGGSGGRSVSGEMKEVDLKKDIEAVQKWALEQSLDSSFSYNGSEYYSIAFGFANLAYQSGMKSESNELIKTLFLNHENPEGIIDQLIGKLALAEYNKIYNEFTVKKNWENYHAGLLSIQEKYPRGWDNQPGLAILIPLVKKRVDDEPVPFPTIEGHPFSDEIKALIGQTAKAPTQTRSEYYGNGNLFLIDRVAKNNKAPAMRQLTQYGMDGFIALVALIGDDTLVVGNQNNNYGLRHGYSSRYNDDGISAEDAYNSLTKPPTRGQVAEQIVRGTLPHNYQELSEIQGEQLKVIATQWWKEHKDDEKFTLIKHYFEHGNQSHINNLSRNLILQDTKDSRKLLEESILTSENPENLSALVKSYVKKRRVNAKEFIIKYQAILLARIGESIDQSSEFSNYQIVAVGGTRKYIASLLRYTEELKPEQLFANLAKKDSNTTEIMEMLGSVYSSKELSEVLNKFIHVAAQTEDAKKQREILGGLYKMIFDVEELPEDGVAAKSEDGSEKVKKVSFTEAEKRDWKKLLTSDVRTQYMSNSHVTGMLLDKHLHPEITGDEYELIWSLGQEVVSEVIRTRSIALLEGTKAEPIPKPALVSEDKKEEILVNLGEVTPVKFREMYEALSYSERLLLMNDPMSRIKFKQAGEFIKGFASQNSHSNTKEKDKIENVSQLKKLLKPLLDKKVGAGTYADFAKIIIENRAFFEGVSVSSQLRSTIPGRDIYFMKSKTFHFPVLKQAMEDVVAGKNEFFVALVAIPGAGGRARSSGQKPLIMVYDKDTSPKPKNLEEITNTYSMTITVVTNKVIEEWKKNPVDGKELIINQLIQIRPDLEAMRTQIEEMPLEQLQEALEQMQGDR